MSLDSNGSVFNALTDYDILPVHEDPDIEIARGWEEVTGEVNRFLRKSGLGILAIDGFSGVPWDDVIACIRPIRRPVPIYDVRDYLKPREQLEHYLADYLGGDDPVFGRLYEGDIEDWFDVDRLNADMESEFLGQAILIGPGASALGDAEVIWLEIPKDILQQKMRAGEVTSILTDPSQSFAEQYKRMYFVEWPALNRVKANALTVLWAWVDLSNTAHPHMIKGDVFLRTVDTIAHDVFRVKPWFAPGAWGGQLLKQEIASLPQDVPNYAWSFELIVPENGVLIWDRALLLEFSFDVLMYRHHEAILGKDADRFGYNFPIRLDYLDTIDGGNLSVQCHPRPDYIRDSFGEPFTQDETYYIVRAQEDARVYLGFRDGIDPDEFHEALTESAETGTAIDIDRFVGSYPAKPHDLFLIPNGTIHSSGKGNLVLEISATPYIYTFKMYDWVRRDLDGKPRPLNIERGMENLYFERTEDVIRREHIPRPHLLNEGDGWQEWFVGSHPAEFFAVHRYEITGSGTFATDNTCHILNIVEGGPITIATPNGREQHFSMGESFVVPAAAGEYTITSVNGNLTRIIKAFVR